MENALKNSVSKNNELLETKLRPFYHTDIKNTLENIVFTEKQDCGKSILEKVFSDKNKTSKATVKDLLN